jgi:hypothetical protein
MEKISSTDRVINEVLHKEERNILRTMKKKGNWIGDSLHRECLPQRVIEGKTE